MASNIPKFASFRPKPKATPEPPIEPRNSNKGRESSKETKITTQKRSPSPREPVGERNETFNKTYYSDRRGDAEVLRYGVLNHYDIPAYRRFGHGYILGLSSDQKIDREHSTDQNLYLTPVFRRRQDRLLIDQRLNKSTHRALRLIKKSNNGGDIGEDFVAISTTAQRDRDDSEDEDTINREMDYRNIEGKPKSTEPLDADTQYEFDTDVGIDTEVIRKNSRFARRTKEHPEDVDGWLALVEHQEAMLKLERPFAELSPSDKAHLAEVRISTYEEALKKIGQVQHSQFRLYKGLLTEAGVAWDEVKLATKWKEVLTRYADSVDLWVMYLDFLQSSFTTFKHEQCRASFLACINALTKGSTIISAETTLHILIRLTSMVCASGYQELAIAIWQAIFEYHFLRPAVVGDAEYAAFEEFWESEVPRIGDPGSRGWKYHSPSSPLPPESSPLRESDPSLAVFEDFRRRETYAMTKLRYPGRTTDDVAEDDAFHTVFFSDIEVYMKLVPVGTSTPLILEAFLCFCGLPPLPRPAAHQRTWWTDPFIRCRPDIVVPGGDNPNPFLQKFEKFSSCPIQDSTMDSDLLFKHSFNLDSARLSPDFVRRLLKLLSNEALSDDIIGEYLLAFELKHFPSEAFETARQLIKTRSSSLRLYNAYGLVESQRGNSQKADQVFSMALSLQKEDFVLYTAKSVQLFHNWVWEALRRDEHEQALWRLVSPIGKVPTTISQHVLPDLATVELAHAMFSQATERFLLNPEYESAVTSTSLLALLAYLSNGREASHALNAHRNLSAWFTSHKLLDSAFAELHAQSVTRFLVYHVTHAPVVKPALIRTTLEPFIEHFPNNTILLSLYAANEARFSINDRVRGIMQHNALHSSSITSVAGWAFAIHYETLRGEIAGSTAHSIRALYKRATASDATGSHCPALWISYIEFEISQLRHEAARSNGKSRGKDIKKGKWAERLGEAEIRVKETFYTGLKKLPWCKDFVMLAFTVADDVFGDEEKWRLYGLLQEKELRVYTELEE